eukprot:gene13629-4530_t
MEVKPAAAWFQPYAESYGFQMSCTVNKPTNLSIWFHRHNQPIDDAKSLVLQNGDNRFAKVKMTNCTATVTIDKSRLSFCSTGEYICIASDNNKKQLMRKTVDFQALIDSSFYFAPDDQCRQSTKDLIEGLSVNLTCSFSLYKEYFGFPPTITFRRRWPTGNVVLINETEKYLYGQSYRGTCNGKKHRFRTLTINRIDAGDSGEYFCRVLTVSRCLVERGVTLKTRPCRAGYHCNVKTNKEIPCPAGTFSNVTGLFSSSGCKICPLNSYCSLASTAPKACPRMSFAAAYHTILKILEGKKNLDQCKICPVDSCENYGHNCTFLCSKKIVEGNAGNPVQLDCKLSKPILVGNLTWMRNNETLSNSSKHTIRLSGDSFTLVIRDMRKDDVGEYICTGVEKVMGNTVETKIRLTLSTSEAWSDVTTVIVWVFVACVLILAIVLLLLALRRKRSKNKKRESLEECVTGSFTDIYLSDRREMFSRIPSNETDSEPDFDVFICYSCADKVWVRRTLLTMLQKSDLRVCIDYEDFEPGEFIIKNIADAISRSRNTIAVLSPDFVNSDWCQKELKMALSHLHKRHQVIPILYRVCAIPIFLLDRTYLDWCNDDVRNTFWEQLVKKVNGSKATVGNFEASKLKVTS